jgi:hypothetical protein
LIYEIGPLSRRGGRSPQLRRVLAPGDSPSAAGWHLLPQLPCRGEPALPQKRFCLARRAALAVWLQSRGSTPGRARKPPKKVSGLPQGRDQIGGAREGGPCHWARSEAITDEETRERFQEVVAVAEQRWSVDTAMHNLGTQPGQTSDAR